MRWPVRSTLLGPGSPLVALHRHVGQAGRGFGHPVGSARYRQDDARAGGRAQFRRNFVELSAVNAGVADVRKVLEQALSQRDLYGITTVLFLDEIHRFSKAQQDALLPGSRTAGSS